MNRLPLLSLLLMGILYGLTQTVAQESDAPFIYYFSPEDHAIIIERADGADRHTIGRDVIASDETVAQIAWSPSGEWVAWISGESWEGRIIRPDADLWIAQADGSDPNLLLEDMSPVYWDIRWSPTVDKLLTWAVDDTEPYWQIGHATVLDVNSGDRIEFFTSNELTPEWSPNGQYIYYPEHPLPEDFAPDEIMPEQLLNVVRASDGHISQRGTLDMTTSMWLTDEQFLYVPFENPNVYYIEDFETGEQDEFPRLSTNALFRWNNQGTFALIYDTNDSTPHFSETQYDLWLFDPSSLSLQHLSNDSITPETKQAPTGADTVLHETWTPDDQYALYATHDGLVHRLSIASSSVETIPLPLIPTASTDALPVLGAKWSEQGDFGLLLWGGEVWYYDLATNSLSPEPLFTRWNFDLSSDGCYVAYLGSCDEPIVAGKCILDLETGLKYEIPPAEGYHTTYYGPQFGFVSWHPTPNYVIFQEASVAGNAQVYFSSLSNPDGTFYRDINADWLPANVHIDSSDGRP